MVDLREESTFGTLVTAELDASRAIFVPRGVGNNYQALDPNTAYTYEPDSFVERVAVSEVKLEVGDASGCGSVVVKGSAVGVADDYPVFEVRDDGSDDDANSGDLSVAAVLLVGEPAAGAGFGAADDAGHVDLAEVGQQPVVLDRVGEGVFESAFVPGVDVVERAVDRGADADEGAVEQRGGLRPGVGVVDQLAAVDGMTVAVPLQIAIRSGTVTSSASFEVDACQATIRCSNTSTMNAT